MTMKYGYKEIAEHYGSDFRSHPIGTGPSIQIMEKVKLVLRKSAVLRR
jgi:peptide/nickel transport system substrate-binding protein